MIETFLNLEIRRRTLHRERAAEMERRLKEVRAQVDAEYSGKIRGVRQAAASALSARLDYVFSRFEEDRTQSFIATISNRWYLCRWARQRSKADWKEYKSNITKIYIAVHSDHPWPSEAATWSKSETVERKGWRWKPGSPHSLQIATDTIVFLDEIPSLDRNRQPQILHVSVNGDKAWITPSLAAVSNVGYWVSEAPAVRHEGPAVLSNNARRWNRRPDPSAGSGQHQTFIKPSDWLGPARLRPEGLPGIIPPLNV
jgi:hypothetical protein